MYVNRNTEVCSFNHCHSGKAINITNSKCVFVFLIIFSVVYIAISGLSGSTMLSTLSHKWLDFREITSLFNLKSDFWFSLQLFFWNTSNFKCNSARYHKSCWSSSKYKFFLTYLNETWIFSTDFLEIMYQVLTKIRPVGAELFHMYRRTDRRADRRTDTTKLIVFFEILSTQIKRYTMKTYEEWRHKSIRSQITALNGSERLASCIGRFSFGVNNPDYTLDWPHCRPQHGADEQRLCFHRLSNSSLRSSRPYPSHHTD
jgi:hypothetical protein